MIRYDSTLLLHAVSICRNASKAITLELDGINLTVGQRSARRGPVKVRTKPRCMMDPVQDVRPKKKGDDHTVHPHVYSKWCTDRRDTMLFPNKEHTQQAHNRVDKNTVKTEL